MQFFQDMKSMATTIEIKLNSVEQAETGYSQYLFLKIYHSPTVSLSLVRFSRGWVHILVERWSWLIVPVAFELYDA